jgi:hypothetical protein
MTVQEWMQDGIPEGGSALLTAYFVDENGDQIPLGGIGTVQLWLDNMEDGATINGRTAVNIKNANGGTVAEVTEDGVARTKLTFTLTPADNVRVNTTADREWHIATISATYNGGAGVVRKEIVFHVVDLEEI